MVFAACAACRQAKAVQLKNQQAKELCLVLQTTRTLRARSRAQRMIAAPRWRPRFGRVPVAARRV
eukprot:559681-Pleurochrysis_carterae.AAC.1